MRCSSARGRHRGERVLLAGGRNFSTLWELSGPFDVPLTQAHLPSADYASPGGNAYLAVIAAPFNETPADITVNSVTFVADDGTTPAFSVSGTITDLVSSDPLAGVTVALEPGGVEVLTDSAGAFAFPDVGPGSYTLTPALGGYTFVPPSRDVELSTRRRARTSAAVRSPGLFGEVLKAASRSRRQCICSASRERLILRPITAWRLTHWGTISSMRWCRRLPADPAAERLDLLAEHRRVRVRFQHAGASPRPRSACRPR
jgi:hypothetical protein